MLAKYVVTVLYLIVSVWFVDTMIQYDINNIRALESLQVTGAMLITVMEILPWSWKDFCCQVEKWLNFYMTCQ